MIRIFEVGREEEGSFYLRKRSDEWLMASGEKKRRELNAEAQRNRGRREKQIPRYARNDSFWVFKSRVSIFVFDFRAMIGE
jgi:hypothetical protein